MGMLLTQAGQNALHTLIAADQPLVITEMSFGTADRHPTGGEAELVAEVIRKPVVNKEVAAGKVRFDAILQRDEGPWTIYEVGLHDDAGTLIAIGRAPGLTKLVGDDDEMHSLDISVSLLTSTLQNLVVEIDPQFALVPQTRQINTGAGMKGGGDLSSDRDLEVDFADTLEAADVTNEVKVLSPAQAPAAIASIIQPGTIAMFGFSTPPYGWLECNGALLSRTAYAALFEQIGTFWGAGDGATTFALPDARGYFPRAWDHGRGIDPGRDFGTTQDDAIRNITGQINFKATTGTASTVTHTDGAYRKDPETPGGSGGQLAVASSSYFQRTYFDASRVVPTAAENRPKNISFLYCMKYL